MCRSGCTSRGSPSTLLSMIDFGLVDAVDADAVGPPGQRHFRLRARVGDQYASLWLEKEQLIEIGRIFSRLLAERSRQTGRVREKSGSIHSFPEEPQVDFQIARAGFDYNSEREHLIFIADEQTADDRASSPTFRMEISRGQAVGFIKNISGLVASGRPLCPLCKSPLEICEATICPQKNGHSLELPIFQFGLDAEEFDD